MTKVRADRTVIAIGVFLFILGLAVAWNGYGYVQIERGWTLVISGTVVFSTGLLLVALGLVLRELRAVAASAARATLLLAKAKTLQLKDFDEDLPAAAPPPSPPGALEPEKPEAAPEFAPVEDEFERPVENEKAERARRLHLPRVDEVAGVSRNPLAWMVRPDKPEPVPQPPQPPDEELEPWLEPKQGESHVQAPPVETLPIAELSPEPPVEDLSGSLDAPEPAPQLESELAPQLEHEPAPVPEPESESQPEAEPHSAAPAEEADRPEIIGHYEAHGAHYVMYADGSIDADTAHGVYRFASMEELKQFIARQE
jgi:hypothetical protein